MNFNKHSQPASEDFEEFQDYFEDALKGARRSEYGTIIKGLELKLQGSRVNITKGCGFTASGQYVELKKEASISISIWGYHFAVFSVVILKLGDLLTPHRVRVVDQNLKELLNEELKTNQRGDAQVVLNRYSKTDSKTVFNDSSGSFDPYKALKLGNYQYEDCIVLGCMKGKTVYLINRESSEPYYPVGSLFLYYGDEFINYVTLRGCVVATEYFDKLIRLDSKNVGETGGTWGWNLGSSSIPTLFTKETRTSSNGSHQHTYTAFNKFYRKIYRYSTNPDAYFNGDYFEGEASGEHEHTASGTYENPRVETVPIIPDYITCIPIRRVY
ncbi:hypothetical protein [Candidatus Borreliella tachyglossi]|uniref:hypothetical protein n=1 Tax=Candidatus Borreliella tachyglossi TaxID=1964448 RepID=UPI00404335E3